MTTLEEIYWALRELQGLGYAERTGPDDWQLTPSGHKAAGLLLESLRPADRALAIMHLLDEREQQ